jgi:hypothetical protein
MSDPKDTLAPAAIVEAKPAPTTEAKPKVETDPNAEPHWLSARLERERANTLKKTGFETLEEAQASATALKSQREAEKTTAEKAADALVRASKAESGEKALKEAVGEFAKGQMSTLSPEQKAAVELIAGDDAAQQLKAIAALAPTWAKPVGEAEKAAPKAVDTAPGANAPPPITTSDVDHKAQYQALHKSNPFAAAAYGLAHANDVFSSK